MGRRVAADASIGLLVLAVAIVVLVVGYDLSAIASIGSAVALAISASSRSAICVSEPTRSPPEHPHHRARNGGHRTRHLRLHDADPGAGVDRHARRDPRGQRRARPGVLAAAPGRRRPNELGRSQPVEPATRGTVAGSRPSQVRRRAVTGRQHRPPGVTISCRRSQSTALALDSQPGSRPIPMKTDHRRARPPRPGRPSGRATSAASSPPCCRRSCPGSARPSTAGGRAALVFAVPSLLLIGVTWLLLQLNSRRSLLARAIVRPNLQALLILNWVLLGWRLLAVLDAFVRRRYPAGPAGTAGSASP